LTLASCTAQTAAPPPHRHLAPSRSADQQPEIGRYVALGDSYTAGPLIPTTEPAGGCFRSDHDYPHLLTRLVRVGTLVDVSCAGATTHDLSHSQHLYGGRTAPPQLASVNAATDLVTLGIGGNDFGLFGDLLACTRRHPGRCSPRRGAAAIADLPRIGSRVTAALHAVHDRAPGANVMLVGYLRLVPGRGSCPRLGLSAEGRLAARRVSRLLDITLSAAAQAGQATYIDAYRLSAGHDLCAARPWVNGRTARHGQGLAYHPNEPGMRAIATAIAAKLR
jgi:lysophospholipase L1-like esterase